MKILLQCLLFLSCNALALSSEIFAWKTPVAVIAPDGLQVPGAKRLEKPPEVSPFFGAKDELWDITVLMSQPDRALSDPPEWIVYNATSGYLVAKVSWEAFFEIQHEWGFQSPPVQCRVKIDVYQVATDGSPPDSSKPPKYSFNTVARSGQKTIASYSESGADIRLECEPCYSDDRSIVDLRTLLSVVLTDGPTSKLDTSVTLLNGAPLWVAREFDGKNGMDFMFTATCELVDGTPFSELVLRQEGNAIMPFPDVIRNGKSGNISIGDKYRLIWQPISIFELLSNLGVVRIPDDGKESDPFAAAGANDSEKVFLDTSKLKTITAPEVLAPHVQGTVFDLGELFKVLGINIPKGELIGYDYKNQRVFIYSSDLGELDKFQALFMLLENHSPTSLVISVRGNGELRLIGRSGMKYSLECNYPKSKQTRFFEVEPTLGEANTYVDARFTYHDRIGEKIMKSMESSATLAVGEPLKILEKSKADGSKESIEMKVEIMDLDR